MSNTIDLTKLRSEREMWRFIPRVDRCAFPIFLFEFGGAIGSGKSETAGNIWRLLRDMNLERHGFKLVRLEEDIWSHDTKKAIDDFYSGKSNSPSTLEKIICGRRLQSLIDAFDTHFSENDRPTVIISDRAFEEDVKFIESLYNKNLDKSELVALDSIRTNIKTFVRLLDKLVSAVVHKVIYLNPGTDEALRRIKKRGRPSEQQIDYVTLENLTTLPQEFYSDPFVVDNSEISSEETATLVGNWILSNFVDSGLDLDTPLPKVLVSIYGVPGSGKTSVVKEIQRRLHASFQFQKFDPGMCEIFLDDSDTDEIEEEQRKIYAKDSGAKSDFEIQDFIDKRRLNDFENIEDDNLCGLTFTDIGPHTSNIFREVYNVKLDGEYLKEIESKYDVFVNVVVVPDNWDDCRRMINNRNRPGEFEWFTPVRLGEIQGSINNFVLCDKRENVFNVVVNNNYHREALGCAFHKMMEKLKDALTWCATDR